MRDSVDAARAVWDVIAERHGLVGRVGADGTDRGLAIGGPPEDVAAFVDTYRRLGIGEVIFVFRDPFDLETIERIGEVRAALERLSGR